MPCLAWALGGVGGSPSPCRTGAWTWLDGDSSPGRGLTPPGAVLSGLSPQTLPQGLSGPPQGPPVPPPPPAASPPPPQPMPPCSQERAPALVTPPHLPARHPAPSPGNSQGNWPSRHLPSGPVSYPQPHHHPRLGATWDRTAHPGLWAPSHTAASGTQGRTLPGRQDQEPRMGRGSRRPLGPPSHHRPRPRERLRGPALGSDIQASPACPVCPRGWTHSRQL